MAKGAFITDNVRMLIALVFDQHKDWRAKEIREEVNRQLREVNPRVQLGWPGLSAIQKEVTKLRKKNAGRSPESKAIDQPWSTIDLARHPISPEALPAVLETWVFAREIYDIPLTIREVQWASRLYTAIQDKYQLFTLARGHALIEKINELTGLSIRLHNTDLEIYEVMTGQEITPERKDKILSATRDEDIPSVAYAEFIWKLAAETSLENLPEDIGGEVERLKLYLKHKEAHDERSHTETG